MKVFHSISSAHYIYKNYKMFSEENFPEARCAGFEDEGKDDSRNKVSEKTKEKLNRMVLGKDKNINEEYIKSFYLDVAEEVL